MTRIAAGWRDGLAQLVPGVRFDEPLSKHTTFRIGGPADAYVELGKASELGPVFAYLRSSAVPWFILGWGSNLLVRDGGVRGVVLRFKGEFDRLRLAGDGRVHAGCAVRLPRLVTYCASHGLAGSEPLVGVPGTVGGALVMNAGTREGEIGDLVREVECFDVETLALARVAAERVNFGYRKSSLEGRIVVGATLELNAGDKGDIMARVRRLQDRRQKTQPIHTYNVGSVFKNPPGRFVAQLIESAGLKGAAHGGARVSPLHANFIENHDGATARDVLALVETMRREIRSRFQLELELEVKVVGEA